MLSPTDKDIVQTRLIAISEEMCLTLQRASRSLYVKETADFACAIADTTGRFVAYPQGIGVSGFVGLDISSTVETVSSREPLAPGDVIITNDPYLSDGLSTHLPDIHAIEPYFDGDELIGYGWTFIHASDVGGRVPSSVSVLNDSIFAEGLRIPPVKYARAGVVVPDIESLVLANTRTPSANDGDLRAMLAALAKGRARVADVLAQSGADGFRESCSYAVEQTSARARAALEQLSDGRYAFHDYLDNDGVSETPLRIEVTATVDRGSIALDFTGTDPQVEAALNMVTFGHAHSWVVTRLFALVGTLDPTVPLNGGLMDVIRFTAPRGTLLNAVAPAAVGVRHATVSRVNDVVSGALIQAAPRLLPAASSGLVVPVVFAERIDGGTRVQVVEPMVGGTGARYGADGIDGRDSGISNLSNNPVEIVEAGVGVRVLRYALRQDSGGPGRWRGGCGLELEFEALSAGSLLARGLERLRFRPWGYDGGAPGEPAELIINEGADDERRVRIIDVLPLHVGDRVTLRTSGAGGYGEAFDRDPGAVLRDVTRGLVSEANARSIYGIAIEDGIVDAAQTSVLREARAPRQQWGFGSERVNWESVFADDAVGTLRSRLDALPIAARAMKRRAVIAKVLRTLPSEFPVGDSDAKCILAAQNLFAILANEDPM
jgi:N-methylhydantoinase B